MTTRSKSLRNWSWLNLIASNRTLTAILLAAGQGTRMKSVRPKVLHALCGRPMIHFVVDAALGAGAAEVVVVVGHGREEVSASLAKAFDSRVKIAVQDQQLAAPALCG